MFRSLLIAVGLALPLLAPAGAFAAEHEVVMLNRGADGTPMVFEPLVTRAAPGDTIKFVNGDRGHNSVSMRDGIPEGAEAWNGRINEEIEVTLTEEGVYMFQCTPHLGMGMIGAIVVGEPTNLDEVREVRYPGRARQVSEEIFTQIESGS